MYLLPTPNPAHYPWPSSPPLTSVSDALAADTISQDVDLIATLYQVKAGGRRNRAGSRTTWDDERSRGVTRALMLGQCAGCGEVGAATRCMGWTLTIAQSAPLHLIASSGTTPPQTWRKWTTATLPHLVCSTHTCVSMPQMRTCLMAEWRARKSWWERGTGTEQVRSIDARVCFQVFMHTLDHRYDMTRHATMHAVHCV